MYITCKGILVITGNILIKYFNGKLVCPVFTWFNYQSNYSNLTFIPVSALMLKGYKIKHLKPWGKQPHQFCSNTITYNQSNESHEPVARIWMSSVQSRFSQWMKIRSLAWCDKTIPLHKIATLTNSLESLKYWNVKYAIRLKVLVVLLLHQHSLADQHTCWRILGKGKAKLLSTGQTAVWSPVMFII